ncbi:unnamed protein product, partial [Mesorhabditis belari]|uniref:Cullin family profile domain-containing protein n=1 Tax=Mesorhabditis belari TaxID=2138241 RepID=A0AAF3ET84_9BILA
MYEVGHLCLEIWKETLVMPIRKRLVDLILQAVSDDRKDVAINDKKIIAGVIRSILQVSNGDFGLQPYVKYATYETTFYQQIFEQQLVARFNKETLLGCCSKSLLSSFSPSLYMEKIIEILAQEEERSDTYFNQVSVKKVIGICRDVLINEHKNWLEVACPEMIAAENTKDLRNMYLLLKPIPSGTQVMTREFESHVKSKGFASISNLNGDNIPALFVENSIQVYQKYSKMKSEVFEDDVDFTHAFDKALQSVINSKDSTKTPKAPERLARFTDSLLRKSTKALSDRDLEKKLDEATIIFRYLEDKDMFQKYFSKMLANRLIMTTSSSMDSEEMMITKLKQACGYEFTSKLSRMFTDIGLSKELSTKYEEYMKKNNLPNLPVPMTPLILGAAAWPLSMPQSTSQEKNTNETKFILPRDLQPCIDGFEKFYGDTHNGRKLSWLFHLSNAEVRLSYLDKPYVINLSTHQLAILLNLQHKDSITLDLIATDTGLKNNLDFYTLYDDDAKLIAKGDLHERCWCEKPQSWRSDKLILLYEVREGVEEKSFGLQVAKMVGFPEHLLLDAKNVLEQLEAGNSVDEELKRRLKSATSLEESKKVLSV